MKRSLRAAAVVGILCSGSVAVAGSIRVVGTPKVVPWPQGKKAYEIAVETGLKLQVAGPADLLFEFRSKERGKKVIIDIVRGDGFRSRNPVKLRPIGGGGKGYRFVTLLTLQVAEAEQTLEIRVQGAELIVVATAEKQFHRAFEVRGFEDMSAPPPESALVGETEPDSTSAEVAPVTGGSDGRDAEVFGAATARVDTEPAETSVAEASLPEARMARLAVVSDEQARVRLAISEDVLSIGGRLYSQFDATALNHTALRESKFGNRNLLDTYFDARPNDEVRGYALGRLIFAPRPIEAVPSLVASDASKDLTAVLDQLWLKVSVARSVFVTVGQQPIRWGTGRFWNPTDFVNQQSRDPLALVDERVGVPLLKLHLPIESLGWNFYSIANFSNINSVSDISGALRAEVVVSTIEVALSTALGRRDPFRAGVDMSADFFGFDIRGEFALRHGVTNTFWRGDFGPDPDQRRFPVDYQRTADWIPQLVLGAETSLSYASASRITLGVEYFRNGAGTNAVDLYPWMILNNAFHPLYVGTQYFAVYATAPNPWALSDTTLSMATMSNLSDGSWLVRLDYRVLVMTSLTLNVDAVGHLGRRGEFRLGFNIPPQTDLHLLPAGMNVRAPWLEVGIGVIINI